MNAFRSTAKVQRGAWTRLSLAPGRAVAVAAACGCAFAGAFAAARLASPPRASSDAGGGAPIAGAALPVSLGLPAAAPIPVGVAAGAPRSTAQVRRGQAINPAPSAGLLAPAPVATPTAPASPAPAKAPVVPEPAAAPAKPQVTAKPAPSGPAEAGKSFDSSG